MKKPIALLLALCMALSISSAAFADETYLEAQTETIVDVVDSGELEAGKPAVSEEAVLYTEGSYVLPERFKAPRAASGNWFREQLTAAQKSVYDVMLPYFENIHSSKEGSSMLFIESGINGANENDGFEALFAIFKDHTELLYWVGKGAGNKFSILAASANGVTKMYVFLPVIERYRSGDAKTESINTSEGKKDYTYYNIKADADNNTTAAFAKADAIAAEATGTDFEKIKFFNKQICDLTSYDDAAAKPDAAYGDASQMINVFLGKPVVCEGYAKAFKYLCGAC